MRWPRLARRRALPVPTLAGWALLLTVSAGAAGLAVRELHPFLAVDAPVGHGLLVVEGWSGEETMREAARLWGTGAYERVLTTGGPLDEPWLAVHTSWAEVAAEQLRRLGVPSDRVLAVPSPASAQERTFLSAVSVRDQLARAGSPPPALDLLSEGPHARRSWHLYRLAFADQLPIGVLAGPPEDYDPAHWWRTSPGAREVVGEAIAWAWTACCFRAPARGAPAERWGEP